MTATRAICPRGASEVEDDIAVGTRTVRLANGILEWRCRHPEDVPPRNELELVWRMAADQRLDLRLLRRVQQALLAWLAPAWLADQPFRPTPTVRAQLDS